MSNPLDAFLGRAVRVRFDRVTGQVVAPDAGDRTSVVRRGQLETYRFDEGQWWMGVVFGDAPWSGVVWCVISDLAPDTEEHPHE